MAQGEHKARTPYAMATEISRELDLGLNNAEVEALASFLGGFSDQEKANRELLSKGFWGARELVRVLRSA